MIVRGDGCYLEDANGKRYLDALAGLFSVNIGYGFGEEIGQAALEQMRELPFYTNWTYAHPRAIELATEVASLAPGDLNRAFFVSGGSEAVESAWKLARQYYLARGQKRLRTFAGSTPERDHDAIAANLATPPRRYKAITRTTAYHGTTLGALSLTGIPAIRMPFEPLLPEVRNVRNTNRYRRPDGETEEEFTADLLAELERTIESMGPETVCLVHMEPVQNSGGAFTAPVGVLERRAGALRPLRHPPLGRRGDHGVRADRRLVRVGALRHPARHHHVREGPLVLVRGDRRGDRDRPRRRAVPRGPVDVHARHHVRRPPGAVRGRPEEHRDHEARAGRRARSRDGRRLPRQARDAPRPRHRRRRPRRGVLLRARARQGLARRSRRSTTPSARRCSAATSRRRSSTRASSAARTTAATPSCRSRRRSSRARRRWTRSSASSATCSPRRSGACGARRNAPLTGFGGIPEPG